MDVLPARRDWVLDSRLRPLISLAVIFLSFQASIVRRIASLKVPHFFALAHDERPTNHGRRTTDHGPLSLLPATSNTTLAGQKFHSGENFAASRPPWPAPPACRAEFHVGHLPRRRPNPLVRDACQGKAAAASTVILARRWLGLLPSGRARSGTAKVPVGANLHPREKPESSHHLVVRWWYQPSFCRAVGLGCFRLSGSRRSGFPA